MNALRLMLCAAPAMLLSSACQTPAAKPPDGKPAMSFEWPAPKGWRTETIPFPLDFAKDLPLAGVEELRFAPGMFKPQEPGYWSYGFVWWLDGKPALGAEELQRLLQSYFQGLTTEVGKEKKLAIDPARFRATIHASTPPQPKAGHGVQAFEGTADLYDAFATGLPMSLNLDVWVWDCPQHDKRVALVLASPQTADRPIWAELRARRDEMACHH